MTAALLKQAREAAQALIDRWDSPLWKDAEHTGTFIARLREVVSTLDAHAALSEYDKAVHALAPYLPEGFVAQDSDGSVHWTPWQTEISLPIASDPSKGWWVMHGEETEDYRILNLTFPRCEDWRKSLRRIVHNQDGATVVEG